MRTDPDVALDCADRLHMTLDLDDRDVAIKVIDGVVLLAGIVRSDQERAKAEQVVQKVGGVLGLTNCLGVSARNASTPPDPEITRDAVAAMRNHIRRSWHSFRSRSRMAAPSLRGNSTGTTSGM
jgi:hypothetical protein